jgi:site-specific recombinase XerD
VRNRLINLRGFYAFAVSQGLRHDNPAADLRPPQARRRPLRPYSNTEIRRFLQGLHSTRYYDRNLALAMLLLSTGWRCSEIRHIRLTDIDFSRGVITLRAEAKGGKHLVACPAPSVLQLVQRYIDRAAITSGWLFPGQPGRPLQRHTIWDMMQTVSRNTGTHFDVRRWRHTFGVRFLLNSSVELLDLNVLWAHSKMETTKGYVDYIAQQRALRKQRAVNPAEPLARRLLAESPPARPGRVA